jgi:hypothetical protein
MLSRPTALMTASFLKNLKKLKLALISGRALTYIKKYPFAGTLYCLLNSNQCAPHRFGSEAGERARNLHLRHGLNVHAGQVTHRAVGDALQLPYTPAELAIRI